MKSLKKSVKMRDATIKGYLNDPLNKDKYSLAAQTATYTGY
jgi:hypothetical protein